ncbi:hypothetical protein [Ammoniphilus sp. 3BR4]|uniref:hypothetical protein n=1 Tax=Ammoniphilus sp. 3BR4 TaxID=3158265 RepID=UPI0034672D6A
MKRKPIYYSNVRSRNLTCSHCGTGKHSVISIEPRNRAAARQGDFLFSFLFPLTEQTFGWTKPSALVLLK